MLEKCFFAGNFSDDKGRKGGNKKADDVSSSVKNIDDELEQLKKNIK